MKLVSGAPAVPTGTSHERSSAGRWGSGGTARISCSLPRAATRAPGFREQRPALVVAPASGNPEVPPGETFATEPGAPHKGDGGDVAGLDIGLHPVQPQRAEGHAERESERLRHVALPGKGRADLTSALVGIAGAFIGFHIAAIVALSAGMIRAYPVNADAR